MTRVALTTIGVALAAIGVVPTMIGVTTMTIGVVLTLATARVVNRHESYGGNNIDVIGTTIT